LVFGIAREDRYSPCSVQASLWSTWHTSDTNSETNVFDYRNLKDITPVSCNILLD